MQNFDWTLFWVLIVFPPSVAIVVGGLLLYLVIRSEKYYIKNYFENLKGLS